MGWAGEGEPGSTGSLRVAWACCHTQGQGGRRVFRAAAAAVMRLDYWKDFWLRRWVASHAKVSPGLKGGDSRSYLGEEGEPQSHPAPTLPKKAGASEGCWRVEGRVSKPRSEHQGCFLRLDIRRDFLALQDCLGEEREPIEPEVTCVGQRQALPSWSPSHGMACGQKRPSPLAARARLPRSPCPPGAEWLPPSSLQAGSTHLPA